MKGAVCRACGEPVEPNAAFCLACGKEHPTADSLYGSDVEHEDPAAQVHTVAAAELADADAVLADAPFTPEGAAGLLSAAGSAIASRDSHISRAALVLAVNLLGDWLRDALNPKLR